MDPDILQRIHRLHVAIGRSIQPDVSKLPARIIDRNALRTVMQDFTGGKSEADLSETLHGLIHNVASFPDHLQKWGQNHAVSEDSIRNFMKASFDFCVVRDLWNCDKHGDYKPGNTEWSRRSPRLLNVTSILELKPAPAKNSKVGIMMGKDGRPVKFGDGSSYVVVTGDVVDGNGGGLGQAHEFIEKSLRVCEAALQRFGVI